MKLLKFHYDYQLYGFYYLETTGIISDMFSFLFNICNGFFMYKSEEFFYIHSTEYKV